MTFVYTRTYLKAYKKLPEPIRKKVKRQLKHLVAYGVNHPGMQTRKMAGFDDVWEARIDIHYRLTFQLYQEMVILRQVGTHEIYRHP